VRLCPEKGCIDETNFLEALELAETDSEKLARLELCQEPGRRRREIATAVAAKGYRCLFRNRRSDVDAGEEGSETEQKRY
jgi:hypothetical protein